MRNTHYDWFFPRYNGASEAPLLRCRLMFEMSIFVYEDLYYKKQVNSIYYKKTSQFYC